MGRSQEDVVFTRIVRPALVVIAAAAISAMTIGAADAGAKPPGADSGPPYDFETELTGSATAPGSALPLKDQGMLIKTDHGYRFRTGQQDSHLVVKVVDGGVRFADTGTQTFKKLSPGCERQKVRGVAAVCRVPATVTVRRPLLIELWPRLGNDYTDTSTLPATFAVAILSDKGHDSAFLGAGPDYFNGFSGRDRVWGGAGNDWVRTGSGNDAIQGGPGWDDILAGDGSDVVRGADGNDRLWAGDGGDRLFGGAGADFVLCGNGRDNATVDPSDRVFSNCEAVHG
jgi:hypothetical protein